MCYLYGAVARAVEFRTRNRGSLGSNPICCCFEARAFSFSMMPQFTLLYEYLAIYGGGNVSASQSVHEYSSRSNFSMAKAGLNASERSRVGVGMNISARGEV